MVRERTRNIEIERVGAAELNEFEYHKNQGALTEQEHGGHQGPTAKPVSRAEQVAAITAAAHRKVEQKRKKAGLKAAAKKTTGKASTKKTTKKKSTKKAGKLSKKR